MRGFHRGGRHGHSGLRGRGGHHLEEKMGRLLGHGDLRYVILSLLRERPRHGYELIKALEELSSGAYSPSPGAIYPTLTFLEEGGFATASTTENKKQYAITPEGEALLQEKQEFVDAILERLAHAGKKVMRFRHWMGRNQAEEVAREDRSPLRKAMHALKAELFSYMDASEEKKEKAAAVILTAAEGLRRIKEEE